MSVCSHERWKCVSSVMWGAVDAMNGCTRRQQEAGVGEIGMERVFQRGAWPSMGGSAPWALKQHAFGVRTSKAEIIRRLASLPARPAAAAMPLDAGRRRAQASGELEDRGGWGGRRWRAVGRREEAGRKTCDDSRQMDK